jgi:integrase
MAVRKRQWRTPNGAIREAWIAEYADGNGVRRARQFARKKDADTFYAQANVAVQQGIHTVASTSPTVASAAADWLRYIEGEGREQATLAHYRQHVTYHINPRLGRDKLASLTTPLINAFRDDLLSHLSRPLSRKVLTSLKGILSDAQRRGNVAQNVARDVKIGIDPRGKRLLEIGRDIPTPEEMRRILAAIADNFYRPLLITAIFTGLRASELRGLPWRNVDLDRGELHVRQRADRYNKIGPPKSKAGRRTIPLGPMVVNTLRAWKLASPPNEHDLMFPSPRDLTILRLDSIVTSGLIPVMIAAGVVTSTGEAKYTGLHALRHFYASWCINRRAEGGLELSPKLVQARLGHATLAMTMDTYGHLFPRTDDGAELIAAEKLLLA